MFNICKQSNKTLWTPFSHLTLMRGIGDLLRFYPYARIAKKINSRTQTITSLHLLGRSILRPAGGENFHVELGLSQTYPASPI
jgi:hypothetical protein